MSELTHHNIKFKESPKTGGPAEWEEEIKKVKGITKVKIDVQEKEVTVEYDIHNCCEEAIEHWMIKASFVLDDSLMQRLKRGWIHYTEENEQDALASKPHSCHDVEEIEEKRSNKPHSCHDADGIEKKRDETK